MIPELSLVVLIGPSGSSKECSTRPSTHRFAVTALRPDDAELNRFRSSGIAVRQKTPSTTDRRPKSQAHARLTCFPRRHILPRSLKTRTPPSNEARTPRAVFFVPPCLSAFLSPNHPLTKVRKKTFKHLRTLRPLPPQLPIAVIISNMRNPRPHCLTISSRSAPRRWRRSRFGSAGP